MIRVMQAFRDERGAGAVEFGLAAPILITMIWGIFQVSMVLWASAGIQCALGEGARVATLYDKTTTSKIPADQTIKDAMNAALFGPVDGTYEVKDPQTFTGYKVLEVKYTRQLNFLFFNGPSVTLDRTKTAYTVINN